MTTGVLVMAYGGPDRLEDVEPYLLDVRNFRPTSRELIDEIRDRYRAIGGRSPILEHTRAQAAALERSLAETGAPVPVRVGMRHWQPRIQEAADALRQEGVTRVVGLIMAPHESELSVGAYCRKASAALHGLDFRCIRSWHLLAEYLDTVVRRVRAAIGAFELEGVARDRTHVLFTAHSLPERIVAAGDPYVTQLEETVRALRSRLDLPCSFAYQSAAATPDPWLGPDAGVALAGLAEEGVCRVVIAPIGFTSEHVEILYDIDIEMQARAAQLGIGLRRIAMMNDDPAMMAGLARRVRDELAAAGWS